MTRIVFLHGGVINRHMWSRVIGELEQHECIAIDLPGHGELHREPFDMDQAVETTLQALGDRGVLVGMSLGGYVAQVAATRSPESVSGLLLSGATIRYMGWDGLSTRFYGYLFPILARPAMKAFAKKLREDFTQEFAEPIISAGLSASGAARALRVLPGTDYAANLSVRYQGPIVIANGERDEGNRDAEGAFLALNPQCSVVTIEDAGHACALQQPTAFAAAVEKLLASVG